jgi:hypothetical protein
MNMKYFISGLLFCLICFVCQQDQTETPTIDEVKMARIMADLAIGEAATTGLSGTRKDSLQQVYFNQTLTIHRVSIEDYEKNLQLYAKDLPKLLQISNASEKLVDREKKEEKGN